jgi:Tol biopolymer transport system component
LVAAVARTLAVQVRPQQLVADKAGPFHRGACTVVHGSRTETERCRAGIQDAAHGRAIGFTMNPMATRLFTLGAHLAVALATAWAMPPAPALVVAAQSMPLGSVFGRWSPDGLSVVFTSDTTGDPEIYWMSRDGRNPKQLTRAPGRDAHPDISPDGKQIVFQSPRDGEDTHIYVMNADGSSQRPVLSLAGFSGVPVWSPDGSRIAFQRTRAIGKSPWHLYVMSADGSGLTQLTDGSASDQVPNWSPDGQRLLFHSDRTGANQLYEIDVASRNVRRFHVSTFDDSSGSYGPDDRSVVFVSVRDGRRAIFELDLRSRRERQLLEAPAHQPSISPDGRLLLFHTSGSGSGRLFVANRDGSGLRQLHPPADLFPYVPCFSASIG